MAVVEHSNIPAQISLSVGEMFQNPNPTSKNVVQHMCTGVVNLQISFWLVPCLGQTHPHPTSQSRRSSVLPGTVHSVFQKLPVQ